MFNWLYKGWIRESQDLGPGRNVAKHLAKVLVGADQSVLGYLGENPVKLLHPNLAGSVAELMRRAAAEGHPIIITSTFRTFAEQDRLYKQGNGSPGSRITNAKAGESYHNYFLAADFRFADDPHYSSPYSRWEKIGKLAEKLGLEWGGRFGDNPHLQYGTGKDIDWRDLKRYLSETAGS